MPRKILMWQRRPEGNVDQGYKRPRCAFEKPNFDQFLGYSFLAVSLVLSLLSATSFQSLKTADRTKKANDRHEEAIPHLHLPFCLGHIRFNGCSG